MLSSKQAGLELLYKEDRRWSGCGELSRLKGKSLVAMSRSGVIYSRRVNTFWPQQGGVDDFSTGLYSLNIYKVDIYSCNGHM